MEDIKLLVSGAPGSGKTTLIRRVVERLSGRIRMQGFYTEEVRESGKRRGFRAVTLDGRSFPLADRDSISELRVGPYGVELEGLEEIGVSALIPEPETRLVILDEIGKMESFSPRFCRQVEALLEGPTPVLATVASHGVGFVKRVRNDPRISLIRIRPRSRDGLFGEVLRRLNLARATGGP